MKWLIAILMLLASVTDSPCQADPAVDQFGGVLALQGNKTGWFHVEEIKGRWYFVTPEGHAFFSLGVTHAGECIRLDERNLFATKYGGSEARLAEFFLGQFKEWGFNSSGYGPLPSMEARIPYVATIWTEGPRSFSVGERSRNSDVFDPVVQKRLRATVRKEAARHVNNPWCLGYVFIDLPVWNVKPMRGPSYVDFIRALPLEAPGRKAYAGFLARYSGGKDAKAAADDEAFMNEIAAMYYRVIVNELRACDPHHLVLGDRLMAGPGRTLDSILATAAKHVDVLSFQPMGTQTMMRATIDKVCQLAGKPVLLADVNTMTMRPAKDQADTAEYERQAGEHTMAFYLDAAASKACIGIHRCTVRDYQPWNLNYHRRGLLKADDTLYPILVDFTQRTNRDVYKLVYGTHEE